MESTVQEPVDNESQEPVYDEATLRMAVEGFRFQQSLIGGLLAGLLAAVVGATAWTQLTIATGYQLGLMAVGVGILVGFAVRVFGKGIDRVFGVMGAVLALFGCLLGNFFTIVYFIAEEQNLAFFETLARLNPAAIPELFAITFSPMDLLFYAIAVYEGYKFAFRQISQDELDRAMHGMADDSSIAAQPA